MNDWVDYLLFGVLLLVVGLLLIFFLVYVPVGLKTDAECLRSGYPKYAVSIGLERYCITLDGTVTVKVDKAK